MSLHYVPEPTGNAPYVGSLAERLVERGHAVRVLTAHPHYPEWELKPGYGQWRRQEVLRQVPLVRLRHYVPTRPTGFRRLLSEASFGIRLIFERWGRPDLVILVSPGLFASAIAMFKAQLLGIKVVTWVQDLYSLAVSETGQGGGAASRTIAAIEARVLRNAAAVVVIHERFRRYVGTVLGVPRDKVEVVRNWSHLTLPQVEDRSSSRERLGWRVDETIVLHAGNMGYKQGLENVVHAARLAERSGERVRFVLLGHGNQRTAIESHASGVTTIQFIDPLPDKAFEEALLSADILLVNERVGVAEMSVPSKLTTYFSTGLPVLAASDPAGITAEEIEVSKGALRVPPGDPAALLQAILRLRRDGKLSASLGDAGRRFREEALGEKAAIDKYDSLLRRIASS